jgi:Tannase and feruloyl esterase
VRILPALLAAAGVLCAQNKPVTGCPGLRSLTNNQMTVAVAVPVPETPAAPAHCRVFGQVLPQVGFEIRMPAEWNGRFMMIGNGGFAGEPTDSPGRVNQYGRYMKRGYAIAATDTGHSAVTEPLGTFATDRQKLFDYAFRSLHVTAEASKLLLRAYYGTAPAKSYFEGCSTGGRQGLILAQRFPDDFDGITVGAPVLNFTGTMVRFVQAAKALKTAPIATTKLPTLAARIYETCDAKDGLKDGIIDDPRRCDFQPAHDLPKCEAGADRPDCFTAAQIGALDQIYGAVSSAGQRIFPAWPVGAEIAGQNGRSGWDPWTVHDGGPTQGMLFGETFFRYLAFGKPDPQYDLHLFDLEKDPARLDAIHQILDATDTDLTRFQQQGGKILMYFGWADPALNPMMGVEYYEAVQARMGPGTTDFFRLFMVPGMFHCGDGPGPNQFDTTAPLSDWVEHGAAPQTIRASKITGGNVARTRPLCVYPQVARYSGTGSIDDSANFTCVKP